MKSHKTILITGGAGFIGTNAAERFIQKGVKPIILDNLSRKGSEINLKYLEEKYSGKFEFLKADVRHDFDKLSEAVRRSSVVLHLAAQVAVTTSVANPREDFEINALGTFNLLEAARLARNRPFVIYSSTNKVYGEMKRAKTIEEEQRYRFLEYPHGISEDQPLDFHSPYGCSKGAADQYVRDYQRLYGIPSVVFRQSCIYGQRQFGVEDQGWVAWFIIAAILDKPITIYGNGKQVRDLLYIDDLIDAYELAIANQDKVAGQIYNMGGGPENTLSLLEFLGKLKTILGSEHKYNFSAIRPGDQPIYVSDIRKFGEYLGFSPKVSVERGIAKLIGWINENRGVIEPIFD